VHWLAPKAALILLEGLVRAITYPDLLEMTVEFDAGIFQCKRPIDGGAGGVALGQSGGDVRRQLAVVMRECRYWWAIAECSRSATSSQPEFWNV
jgi:hypothetical protein